MTRPKKKTYRFTHIHLENWRNFASIDIDLQSRVFLVGPNASGKSNFLDVFRFFYDVASVGGGFEEAVRKRGGVSSLRCLAARKYSDIVVRAGIGNEENNSAWKYELCFNQDKLRRPYIKKEIVSRSGEAILARPIQEDKSDIDRLRQTHLEQVLANQEFREVAEFFKSVHYLHIVPQLVREPDRSVGRKNDPYGGDFLEQIARTPKKTQDSRLLRIKNALQVAVPQLKELVLDRDKIRGTPHLRGKYEHWRPHGAWQTEEVFSDGTLRLLGLLWAALEGSGPLLLEEPELSLHPGVVQHISQMFARIQRKYSRQVMISTHSSDLLRDDGIGLDEVLLLQPKTEGTSVRPTSEFKKIEALLEGGSNLADIVTPMTSPDNVSKLPLFAE